MTNKPSRFRTTYFQAQFWRKDGEMKRVIIKKTSRFGAEPQVEFQLQPENELELVDALLEVAKRLEGFSFEIKRAIEPERG